MRVVFKAGVFLTCLLLSYAVQADEYQKNGHPCVSGVCIGDGIADLSEIKWKKIDFEMSKSGAVQAVNEKFATQDDSNNVLPYITIGKFDNLSIPLLAKFQELCFNRKLEGSFIASNGLETNVWIKAIPSTDLKTQNFRVVRILQLFPMLQNRYEDATQRRSYIERYKDLNAGEWSVDIYHQHYGLELLMEYSGAKNIPSMKNSPICSKLPDISREEEFVKTGNPCIKEVCIGDDLSELTNIRWKVVSKSMPKKSIGIMGDPTDRVVRKFPVAFQQEVKNLVPYISSRAFDNASIPALLKFKGFCYSQTLYGTFTSSEGIETVVTVKVIPSVDLLDQNFRVTQISQVLNRSSYNKADDIKKQEKLAERYKSAKLRRFDSPLWAMRYLNERYNFELNMLDSEESGRGQKYIKESPFCPPDLRTMDM